MKSALIGYTGFVGSTLLAQTTFNDCYNSKNIQDIKDKEYDLLVCAGAPAVKWKANQQPEEDWGNLQGLISNLDTVKVKKFILISTVDVYQTPIDVTEESLINTDTMEAYGKHRYLLEQFVRDKFSNHIIIRLPGLFGEGLKKNFIFDLIHNNCLDLTHKESVFQFYDMSRLWSDIEISMDHQISTINFATEPVSAEGVSMYCMNKEFGNVTEKSPVNYDMKSLHASIFGQTGPYLISHSDVLNQIKHFIDTERAKNETSSL